MRNIVLLSRDPAVLRQAGLLMLSGCQVLSLMRGEDLLDRQRQAPVDLLLLHPHPMDMETGTLLDKLEAEDACPPWAAICAPQEADEAVGWMKRGALDVMVRSTQWEEALTQHVDRLITRADSMARLKQARRERMEQGRLRDAMLEGMPGLVLAFSPDGTLVSCNPAARQLGFLPGQLPPPGDGARDWSPPPALFTGLDGLRRVQEWEGLGFDTQWSFRDGLAICLAQQRGQRQEEERRRRRLERKRLQSQKMEALRALATHVTHAVSNQLVVIQSSTEMLQHRFRDDERAQEWAASLLSAATTLEEQVQSLGLLGRGAPVGREPVDVHELVRKEVERLRARFPLIKTRLSLDATSSDLPGRRGLLAGALAAVLVNACEAMADGGLLQVQTRTMSSGLEEGGLSLPTHLQVLISDSGEGMDEEVLERALDPYYSTRSGHAGLGLGQAWACMRAHRGDLELDSVPGHGTQVRLLLPLKDHRTASGLRREAGRVLLVDDDDVVRGVAGSILRSLGWEVEAFASGPEALAWTDAGWPEVDLALLDLRMPLMNGWELLDELRKRNPKLRALLMTAWADDLPRERLRSGEILGVLAKPFEMDELHAALEMAKQRLDEDKS